VLTQTAAPSRDETRLRVRIWLAFFAVYVLWGSTYLSIRIAVSLVPPLFAAGIRFTIAGLALYLWCRLRDVPTPSRLQWRNLSILGALMFLAAYGGLFWAEKTLPSGLASILVATIPLWTALWEILVFKRQRARVSVLAGIGLGLAGVVTLASDSTTGGVALLPCLAILGSEIAWSFGTVITTMMALPSSKAMSAAAQMLTGGVMLLVCSLAIRETPPFPHFSLRAVAAIAYLIVAGSLIAFTAFQWLLTRMPSTTVTSYAYVNPVVALAIGHWLGGEAFGARMGFGSALVLASTIALLRNQTKPALRTTA